nr:putative ribonuclease H-like domain-containing protein [Tanacetum cinerariifolium]
MVQSFLYGLMRQLPRLLSLGNASISLEQTPLIPVLNHEWCSSFHEPSVVEKHRQSPFLSASVQHLNPCETHHSRPQSLRFLPYPRDYPSDLEAFSDSDYAGANRDRKSTTGGCQFLGRRLISWQCKKQTIFATSSCEAKYVAAALCCGQWFLFTSAGRVTFCWLYPIPAGDLVSAGHMLFLLPLKFLGTAGKCFFLVQGDSGGRGGGLSSE